MEGNVEARWNHIEIEAEDLDVKPGHNCIFRGWQFAITLLIAIELVVEDSHLDIEDRTLVAEDWDGVTNAAI